jgi:class 3 adenylate cyclase/Tfp pilus assembly protein PilF
MKYLVLLILIFCSFQTKAQNELQQLVKTGYDKSLNDKTRLTALHKAGSILTDSKVDSALIILEDATLILKSSRGIDSVKFAQDNNLIRARAYLIQGLYPKALEYAQIAMNYSEKLKQNNLIADCYSVIGQIYERQENNAKAEEYYKKNLKLSRVIGDSVRLSTSLSLLGNIYGATKRYEESLKCYNESLTFINPDKNPVQAAIAYGNIGYVYYEVGTLEQSKNELKSKTSSDYFNKSLEATNNAMEIFKKIGNKRFQIIAGLNTGLVYNQMGDYVTAKKWCQSAYDAAVDLKIPPLRSDACECLYKSNKAIGNADEALKYFEIYKQISDSIKNTDNERSMVEKELNFNYEKEKLSDSLQYAQKEAIADSQIQKQRIGLISASGIVVLIVLLMVVLIKGKKRSEELLLNILPFDTAQELKKKGMAETKNFDSVTVLFTDFKGFTTISELLSPKELVTEIDTCFKGIDKIMGKYNIEKIKTIGDAYMAAGGLPTTNTTHPIDVVMAAQEIILFMESLKQERIKNNKPFFEIRIGIHTGPVIAGIVGIKKFSYDIWGDTVNTASRLESSGEVNKINLSGATYELIKDKYQCEHRGKIEAKNKGKIDMYFLVGKIQPS